MNSVSYNGWSHQVMWLWFIYFLYWDFQNYGHQFVVVSGFHLYALTCIQTLPLHRYTHIPLEEMDHAYSWRIREFLIPWWMRTVALFLLMHSNLHCLHLSLAWPIASHCYTQVKAHTFSLKGKGSFLWIYTWRIFSQSFQSFACTIWGPFFFFLLIAEF